MNQFRADLHCHSTCSDGTSTPSQIIRLALDAGLQGLSITDHDTIGAYKQAIPAAEESNLPLISGVELSAIHKQKSVHILAYSFSLESLSLNAFCMRHHERRKLRSQKILALLAANGMPLTSKDFPPDFLSPDSMHSIGRPHIALAMIKKGYVNSIQQAFQYFIGEEKPCYIPGDAVSVEETLEAIHRAKGLSVIAHPHLIKDGELLKDLLAMPFDGIEGYYARFPPIAHERWLKIAKRKNWIATGGSDFHGENKPSLSLGSSWVGAETFANLLKHFEESRSSLL